jgi:hypothetical protein
MRVWGSFARSDLENCDFAGFVTVAGLLTSRCAEVPAVSGVYVVCRTEAAPPTFLLRSVGGHFKGNDPTVPVGTLTAKWIDGACTIYIGKAATSTLRSRVRQLMDYGAGRPVGHQGGRYLWQVSDSGQFLVAWLADPEATALENEMLSAFASRWGGYPFANIAGPRG